MALSREKIERLEIKWGSEPWKHLSYSRKWLKRQMNKYLRIKSKKDYDNNTFKREYKGWEY